MFHPIMDPHLVMVYRAIRYYVVLTMPMELFLSLVALTLLQGCVKPLNSSNYYSSSIIFDLIYFLF